MPTQSSLVPDILVTFWCSQQYTEAEEQGRPRNIYHVNDITWMQGGYVGGPLSRVLRVNGKKPALSTCIFSWGRWVYIVAIQFLWKLKIEIDITDVNIHFLKSWGLIFTSNFMNSISNCQLFCLRKGVQLADQDKNWISAVTFIVGELCPIVSQNNIVVSNKHNWPKFYPGNARVCPGLEPPMTIRLCYVSRVLP